MKKTYTAAEAFARIQSLADQITAIGQALQQHEESSGIEQADMSNAISKTADHLYHASEEITRCMGEAVFAARNGSPHIVNMLATLPLLKATRNAKGGAA